MRIPFKLKFLNNQDKQISIPTAWSDLTVHQVIELNNVEYDLKGSRLKVLCILTDMQPDEIESSKDLQRWDQIENMLSFVNETPDLKAFPFPDHLTFNDQSYPVPKDLMTETFGQKIAVEECIRHAEQDEAGDIKLINLVPYILSVYFYPLITGEKFKEERVEDFEDQMKQLPIKLAYPVAAFFLSKYKLSLLMKPEAYEGS